VKWEETRKRPQRIKRRRAKERGKERPFLGLGLAVGLAEIATAIKATASRRTPKLAEAVFALDLVFGEAANAG